MHVFWGRNTEFSGQGNKSISGEIGNIHPLGGP